MIGHEGLGEVLEAPRGIRVKRARWRRSPPGQPNGRVRNSMTFPYSAADYGLSPSLAMNLMAVTLGRNTYAAALVVTKLDRPVTSIAGPPFACGMTKMLSAGFCVPVSGSFDFG
jgi:hypothetical protein